MSNSDTFKQLVSGLNGFLHVILGGIFIIIGVIGLFVPIIPGVLLILAGLYLVGGRRLIRKAREFFEKRK